MFEFFSNISKIKFVGELTVDVVFLRLLLAVIFGGLVGIERERKHKVLSVLIPKIDKKKISPKK